MNTTISVMRADTGAVGGHIRPSIQMLEKARGVVEEAVISGLLTDGRLTHTGDNITLLLVHTRGKDNSDIHKFAWDTFAATAAVAEKQGLYSIGQDLLKDEFSGSLRGTGPASAEIDFEERPSEPFIVFAGDKCGTGVFNYPLFKGFSNPAHHAGYTFTFTDVSHSENNRIVRLKIPDDYYEISILQRESDRYVLESVVDNASGLKGAAVSVSRHQTDNGKFVNPDDPVAIVRIQFRFPSGSEILSPWVSAQSKFSGHHRPQQIAVMPVVQNSPSPCLEGSAIMSAAGYCVHAGKLTDVVDYFDQPFWQVVRDKTAVKILETLTPDFDGSVTPSGDLPELAGATDNLNRINEKFIVRN